MFLRSTLSRIKSLSGLSSSPFTARVSAIYSSNRYLRGNLTPMANVTPLNQEQRRSCGSNHICSIVPPHILQTIIDSGAAPDDVHAAVQRCLDHSTGLRTNRAPLSAPGATIGAQSIIPPHVLQSVIDSESASTEDRERAQHTLDRSDDIREARAGVDSTKAKASKIKHATRQLYDANERNRLPGVSARQEGNPPVQDEDVNQVYDFFGQTFDFYSKVFGRNSIDDKGLKLVGSVHFDNQPGPPGYDNAFWNGKQMIFGDGDGTYFGSFTRNLDVIGHELTHGVTSMEANLEYLNQSGALNESVSDVFGIMVKQFFLNQTSADADWLIGEGIFTSRVNGLALRSMKAPGTAYDDPVVGKDPQPAKMENYVEGSRDEGGVHINSGIPNRAFFLAAVGLGGNSWDRAGPIWYATLTDPEIRNTDGDGGETRIDFKTWADFTCKHAMVLYGDEAQGIVKQAWTDVGVYSADDGQGGDDDGSGEL